jgi:hypothetical protein
VASFYPLSNNECRWFWRRASGGMCNLGGVSRSHNGTHFLGNVLYNLGEKGWCSHSHVPGPAGVRLGRWVRTSGVIHSHTLWIPWTLHLILAKSPRNDYSQLLSPNRQNFSFLLIHFLQPVDPSTENAEVRKKIFTCFFSHKATKEFIFFLGWSQ